MLKITSYSSVCIWIFGRNRLSLTVNVRYSYKCSKKNVSLSAQVDDMSTLTPNFPIFPTKTSGYFRSVRVFNSQTAKHPPQKLSVSSVWLWDFFLCIPKKHKEKIDSSQFLCVCSNCFIKFIHIEKPQDFVAKSLNVLILFKTTKKMEIFRMTSLKIIFVLIFGAVLVSGKHLIDIKRCAKELKKWRISIPNRFSFICFEISIKELDLLNRPRPIRMQNVFMMTYWAITID